MIANFDKKANREFFNNKLLFKTVGVLFLAGLFVLIFTDFKIYQKKQGLISQINAYQKQIEDIKKNNQTLKDEIANSDNPDYYEKLAYEQFDQARPGETVYSFIMPQDKPKTASNQENFLDMKSWSGRLGQVWNWIKSKF